MNKRETVVTSAPALSPVRTLIPLWLSGAALRLSILALPPVLPLATSDLGLKAIDIGVLAGLPSLLFALAAIPSALLMFRFGPMFALLVGLVLNAFGSAARGFSHDAMALEGATALMCLGVALMQPALPPLVRAWAPSRIGFATAVYTNGLIMGEIIPIAWVPQLTLPLIGDGWRASLAIWALPIAAIALIVATLRSSRSAVPAKMMAWWPNWRDRRVWHIGLLLGGINATYFGLNGFIPGLLSAKGLPELIKPSLIALNIGQLPASALMLLVAGRLVRMPRAYVCLGALLLAGVASIALTSGYAIVIAATIVGFSAGSLLTLALALPSVLGDPADVPRLSAAMFTVSYGFSMGAALLAGKLWSVSGLPTLSFVPFAVAASLVILLGAALRFRTSA